MTKITLTDLKQHYTLEMAKTAHAHIINPDDSPTIYHNTMTRVANRYRQINEPSSLNQDNEVSSLMNIFVPKFKTNYKKYSFRYQIGKIWNSLPYPVKLKDRKSTFVDAVTRYIISSPNI